jgi:hypothetical protein
MRESWLAVVQTADGEEETELVVIDAAPGCPPVIELSDGVRITCVEPVGVPAREAAA